MSSYEYDKKLGEWKIPTGAVALTDLSLITTNSFLGRKTAGTGVVEVLSVADAKTILDISSVTSAVVAGKLDASAYVQHFKGVFTSLGGLTSAFPTAIAGDYAQVDPGSGTNLETYAYDLADGWVKSNAPGSSISNTDALTEGSTNLYFTQSRVRGTLLTGLNVSLSGAITSSDSIIDAFGKVQNSLNGKQGAITLTTTGTSGAATFASNVLNIPNYSSGGGGLTNFSDVSNTTTPNTTVPINYLIPLNAATDVDSGWLVKGNGAKVGEIFTDGTTTLLNKRGIKAIDLQCSANSIDKVAGAKGAVIIGGKDNWTTQSLDIVYSNVGIFAGSGNSIIDSSNQMPWYSVIVGGLSNSITGFESTTCGIYNSFGCTISHNLKNAIMNSSSSTITGARSTIVGGDTISVTVGGVTTLGGVNITANVTYGVYFTSAASSVGIAGDTQSYMLSLKGRTTSATAIILTTDSTGTANASNIPIIKINGCIAFRGQIVTKQQNSVNMSVHDVSGRAILNNTGTTVTVTGFTATAMTGNTLTPTITCVADNTNKGIQFKATGVAATNILINSTLFFTELFYN